MPPVLSSLSLVGEKAEILHKAVFVNILVLKTEQNELTIFMYLNFLEVIPTTFV